MISVRMPKANWGAKVSATARAELKGARMARFLEATGAAMLTFLRSYTSERRPGGRPAHPGHWGDITFLLMRSYDYRVIGGSALLFSNSAPYAAMLEARDGFWVLHGLGDSVEFTRALKAALKSVYPKAVVRAA